MDYFDNGVPLFNGQNGLKYEIWSGRMKVFLKAQGYDICNKFIYDTRVQKGKILQPRWN
jgi:hypothetical protein